MGERAHIEIEGELVVRVDNYEGDRVSFLPPGVDESDADEALDLTAEIAERLTPLTEFGPGADPRSPGEGFVLRRYGRYRLLLEPR